MFVRDFIHVAQPFESVAPRFVADAEWLSALAEDAALDVRCATGPVRVRLDSLVVPIVISGATFAGLPQLEADLEISPLGPDSSQLTMSATYRRPAASDPEPAVVHRAAETGVRNFLRALAASLDGVQPVG